MTLTKFSPLEFHHTVEINHTVMEAESELIREMDATHTAIRERADAAESEKSDG